MEDPIAHPHPGQGSPNEHEMKLDSNGKSKRNRPRHQKLYADIRKQMEFYFSDANITKNRMMKEMVQGSEYVKLEIFMGFHKITGLTQNVEELRKALKNSEKLELSEDGLGVNRKIPFDETKLKDEQHVENCTIYVENIPKHVDHEWIDKIFQEFGSIAYISVPKFRKSGQPKGFAFVEFEEQVSADRCLEAYGSMGACLSTDIDPSDLQSVKSFDDEHPPQSSLPAEKASPDDIDKTNGNTITKKNRKREFEQSDTDTDTDAVKAKKDKKEEKSPTSLNAVETNTRKRRNLDQTDSGNSTDDLAKKRRLESEPEESFTSALESVGTTSTPIKILEKDQKTAGEKESKRKRRRKNKKSVTWKEADVQLETDSIQLRILPKTSWRKLRNRYLNLQRENMSKLKKQLKQRRERTQGDGRVQKAEAKFAAKSNCVKIILKQPAESVESFRSLISDLAPKDWSNFLKYVDYKEGDVDAVVRFDGGPHAILGINTFFQNAVGCFKDAAVMSEEETTAYWMAVKSRTRQQAQPKKVIRGKDRLTNEVIKAANIHIRFDDNADNNEDVPPGIPGPKQDD